MIKAALALIALFALGSLATEWFPSEKDSGPEQEEQQRQIYLEREKSEQKKEKKPIEAFVESLKGPSLECANNNFKFELKWVAGRYHLVSSRFFAVENEGFVYKKIGRAEAQMWNSHTSDCPLEITQKQDPKGLHLRICMATLAAASATYQVHDPVRDQNESNTLSCKTVNGFLQTAELPPERVLAGVMNE